MGTVRGQHPWSSPAWESERGGERCLEDEGERKKERKKEEKKAGRRGAHGSAAGVMTMGMPAASIDFGRLFSSTVLTAGTNGVGA